MGKTWDERIDTAVDEYDYLLDANFDGATWAVYEIIEAVIRAFCDGDEPSPWCFTHRSGRLDYEETYCLDGQVEWEEEPCDVQLAMMVPLRKKTDE